MIYLDHAATSYPKPASVLAAVEHWYRDLGVSADRGDSRRCAEVAVAVRAARAGLGELAGLAGQRVAFTSGATESINLFLRGFLRPGDRVLTTAFEHSSVVRPLQALARERQLQIDVLAPTPAGSLSPDAVAAALRARPRLLAFTHASNVTGAVFDAAAFCALARRAGCTTLLDVSQTAGHLDLRVGADAVAGSAHKALLAPPGLGFLAVAEGVEVIGQKQGGTGSSVALAEHPQQWPTAFEAGTPNTPAILGLAAALAELRGDPPAQRLARALARLDEFRAAMPAGACRVLAPPPGPRTPVLSFVQADMDPAEIGALFDAADVHVRTGFHCAPWIHAHLGTADSGTVRVSTGSSTTAAEVRAAAAVLAG
jgi:selenocysteine lyase/cysteine desulfurase